MNKHILALIFILSGLLTFGQKECKDEIYTLEGDSVILDCCIKAVKEGNIVYYTKDGDTLNIAAKAITKGSKYYDLNKPPVIQGNQNIQPNQTDVLYNSHDYNYYKRLYQRSKVMEGFGVFITVTGVCLIVGGFVVTSENIPSAEDLTRGKNLKIAGLIFEAIGIPLLMSGGVRKNNHKRAMEEIDRTKALTLGINANGFGLTYRF